MKVRQSAERLGNCLLEYSNRRGDRDQFELIGEKRLLASLLGMTPENLSRAFGTLKSHGVALDGAKVTIEDRERLSRFARPDPVPNDPR
jgi:CRP/FNR family transcriptional activator FtrB